MPDFDIPTPRPLGDARSRRRLWEDPTRPAGLREYSSGDSLRRVDWKATARHGELLVRTYDHRVAQSVVIAVDVDTSEKPWEGYSPLLLERVVTAAASVAMRVTDLGHRVGLISNAIPLAETARMVIPPGADPARLATILESLAMVRPISMSRIERVLEAERAAIPYGAALIVISAIFADPLRAACERLAARGHPAVVVYVGDGPAPVVPVTGHNLAVIVEGERFDPPAKPRKGRGRA